MVWLVLVKHNESLGFHVGPIVLHNTSNVSALTSARGHTVIKIYQQMATLQQKDVPAPLWCCRWLPLHPLSISCRAPGGGSIPSFLLLRQVYLSQLSRCFPLPLLKHLEAPSVARPTCLPAWLTIVVFILFLHRGKSSLHDLVCMFLRHSSGFQDVGRSRCSEQMSSACSVLHWDLSWGGIAAEASGSGANERGEGWALLWRLNECWNRREGSQRQEEGGGDQWG